MRKMEFFQKEGRPINANKMGTSSNAIQMDNSQTLLAIGHIFWFYHPQNSRFLILSRLD